MTATVTSRAEAFRDLHAGPELFVIPNPWDQGTARVLAGMGAKALATTSAGLAYTLGRRDGEGAISREEALDHTKQLIDAVDIPVSADFENGFADDPADIAETIRLAAEIGLAGASIEDATGNPVNPIYPFDLAVERIAAAVEVVRGLGRPFMLTARSENLLHGISDLDDTFQRLKAFQDVGADVLYAPGLRRISDIRDFCTGLDRPINVLASLPNAGLNLADLQSAGVRRVSVGSTMARAAMGAMIGAFDEMMADGTFTFADKAPGFAALDSFMTTQQ